MDPKACLDRAECALAAAERNRDSDDLDECYDALGDYDTWIRNGGFAPPGGAKRRAALGERFDALRDDLGARFNNNGWGDAAAYQDGGE